MTHENREYALGEWCWHVRHLSPCRIVDQNDLWGEISYRIWLPDKETIIRVRAKDLRPLGSVHPTVEHIQHASAAAKLLDAVDEGLCLSPIQTSIVPLPHQLHALERAMGGDRVRYLLADEVGLGKTIEAGLIMRELKLRGMAQRTLVVAPKGLVRQWQAEMRQHFGERFQFIEPAELSAFRKWRDDEENLWRLHDQAICSLDSVKPLTSRRGWSQEQVSLYNRERFEDLISASWDLVIIDEAHRMGGSTDQVARYKLGAALAEAAPHILLLSATPHQGKTDQFLRLMQLLDRESFPDESSVSSDRVRPFVVRTEKRAAIDAEGNPLFRPRKTRLHPVAWLDRHSTQQSLYEAVTDYVRHGYDKAIASKQSHIGFMMILMQRLVSSSTAAIRTTLEKRLLALDEDRQRFSLFSAGSSEQWHELSGEEQIDLAVDFGALADERKDVESLLSLARRTEAHGTDAKAEALLELIYELQREEADPKLKLLVFTEFVSTQSMLADFLESRGFQVTTINGGMDLETRELSQKTFGADARILVSTDAGGEGLNLQFCHVVVNFDMPWNPMRMEQRIGRVDRIGQSHVVRAINFVLEDTVEHRVREVLEAKLAIIAEEFGIDKVADVMDSTEAEPLFDELFVQGIQNPNSIERVSETVLSRIRSSIAKGREDGELLSDMHSLEADVARERRDHPAQFWLERAVTAGLAVRGGEAVREGEAWRLRWMDGSESINACFDAKTAGDRPDMEWVTLEDSRAREVVEDLPRCVLGQVVPTVRISGLPKSVRGIWSLWMVGLSAGEISRRRFLPVFVDREGRIFQPTALRIWELLFSARIEQVEAAAKGDAEGWFDQSRKAALAQGEGIFAEMVKRHATRIKEERARAEYAYNARRQAIGRIGLPTVRERRRKRLDADHRVRLEQLDGAQACMPDLVAILMLRVDETSAYAQ